MNTPGVHHNGHGPGDNGSTAKPSSTRFLQPADVAEILAVSEALVYAMLRSDELPGVKIGERGFWRVSHAVLESWIADREREAYARVAKANGEEL